MFTTTEITEVARLAANNPGAEPELLRLLAASSDETTRKGVATNPNTPTDVLLRLGVGWQPHRSCCCQGESAD